MKKMIAIVLLFVILATTACQPAASGPGTVPTEPSEPVLTAPVETQPQTTPTQEPQGDLQTVLKQIVQAAGQSDLIESSTIRDIPQEEVGFLIGTDSFDGKFEEGVAMEPLMNVHPFAMGIFRLAEGDDPIAFAKELKEKANLIKWICVEAESMLAATKGQTVLFIMGSAEEVNALAGAAAFIPVK
ncbi:MAG TPA: hypothetical protein VFD19_00420 [Clostridia bacterium]|nr:hypothetical protein [Clostridia bacterium]